MVPELPEVLTARAYGFDALRPEIRAGELIRLRPGAYLPPALPDTPAWKLRRRTVLARCVAVTRKFRTPFAFSHATAALIYGWIDSVPDDGVHLVQTVNPGAGQPEDVTRHVRRDLAELDVTTVAGLPVTGVAQTVIDCARSLPPPEALAVVDGALRTVARMSTFRRSESEARQALVRDRLRTRLERLGSARGVRRARMVLELADGFAANAGESRMRWVALRGGLPVPVCQYELWVDGRQYFADAAWVGEAADRPTLVIAEFDGNVKYGGAAGAAAVAAEKRREDAIRRRHGAEFVRLIWPTLLHPDVAFRELLEAFPPGCVPLLHPRSELQIRPASWRRDRRSSANS